MGASNHNPQKSNQLIPNTGGKIIKLLKPELQKHLSIYTDYIVNYSTFPINIQMENIQILVFSILNYSTRKEVLNFNDYKTGIQIKISKINDCMLKITKVFSGSPLQKSGISAEQYIVGVQNQQFEDLKGFVDNLKKIIVQRLSMINIIICDKYGKTRSVFLSLALLDEWKIYNKGILGCELAEGWANKFTFNIDKIQRKDNITLKNVQNLTKKDEKELIQIKQAEKKHLAQSLNSLKQQQDGRQSSEQSEEIQKRLNIFENHNKVIEKNFKGILKGQKVQDASSICKCKVYDKHCEKCFVMKENNYYFFNKKTTRIINIPANLLFQTI